MDATAFTKNYGIFTLKRSAAGTAVRNLLGCQSGRFNGVVKERYDLWRVAGRSSATFSGDSNTDDAALAARPLARRLAGNTTSALIYEDLTILLTGVLARLPNKPPEPNVLQRRRRNFPALCIFDSISCVFEESKLEDPNLQRSAP